MHDNWQVFVWLLLYDMGCSVIDRLCGLVDRIPCCRSRGSGSIPGEVVGLERGPLSLVSTTEGLLERKITAPV
jgi:hypothetical protein